MNNYLLSLQEKISKYLFAHCPEEGTFVAPSNSVCPPSSHARYGICLPLHEDL